MAAITVSQRGLTVTSEMHRLTPLSACDHRNRSWPRRQSCGSLRMLEASARACRRKRRTSRAGPAKRRAALRLALRRRTPRPLPPSAPAWAGTRSTWCAFTDTFQYPCAQVHDTILPAKLQCIHGAFTCHLITCCNTPYSNWECVPDARAYVCRCTKRGWRSSTCHRHQQRRTGRCR